MFFFVVVEFNSDFYKILIYRESIKISK